MLDADVLLTEVFSLLMNEPSQAGRAALALRLQHLALCMESGHRYPDVALRSFRRDAMIEGALLALHAERPSVDFERHRPAATALIDGSLVE